LVLAVKGQRGEVVILLATYPTTYPTIDTRLSTWNWLTHENSTCLRWWKMVGNVEKCSSASFKN